MKLLRNPLEGLKKPIKYCAKPFKRCATLMKKYITPYTSNHIHERQYDHRLRKSKIKSVLKRILRRQSPFNKNENNFHPTAGPLRVRVDIEVRTSTAEYAAVTSANHSPTPQDIRTSSRRGELMFIAADTSANSGLQDQDRASMLSEGRLDHGDADNTAAEIDTGNSPSSGRSAIAGPKMWAADAAQEHVISIDSSLAGVSGQLASRASEDVDVDLSVKGRQPHDKPRSCIHCAFGNEASNPVSVEDAPREQVVVAQTIQDGDRNRTAQVDVAEAIPQDAFPRSLSRRSSVTTNHAEAPSIDSTSPAHIEDRAASIRTTALTAALESDTDSQTQNQVIHDEETVICEAASAFGSRPLGGTHPQDEHVLDTVNDDLPNPARTADTASEEAANASVPMSIDDSNSETQSNMAQVIEYVPQDTSRRSSIASEHTVAGSATVNLQPTSAGRSTTPLTPLDSPSLKIHSLPSLESILPDNNMFLLRRPYLATRVRPRTMHTPPLSTLPPNTRSHHTTEPQQATISNLPHELLEQIFVACLPDYKNILRPTLLCTDAPFILRRVCCHWNRIAVRCPLLWGTIAWSVAQIGQKDTPAQRDGIQMFIERRRGAPFDFVFYHIGDGEMTATSREIMGLLQPLALQCKHLQLVLPEQRDYGSACTSSVNRQPLSAPFRTFSLSTSKSLDFLLPPEFLGLPLVPKFDIPWSQLNAVSLDCPMSADECVDLLQQCSRLKSAAFLRVSKPYHRHIPPVFVDITSLKITTDVDITPLFETVTFSNSLTRLEVHRFDYAFTRQLDNNTVEDVTEPSPLHWNIVWSSLETLILHYCMRLSDAHNLFSCCNNLVKLQWRCDSIETIPTSVSPFEVVLPNLSFNLPRLIDLTITPNLVDAEVGALVNAFALPCEQASRVTLPSLPVSWTPENPPALNATFLKLTRPIAQAECLLALPWLASVAELELEIFHGDQGRVQSPRIEMRRLLVLTIHSSVDLDILFASLYVPLLETLVLDFQCHRRSSPRAIHQVAGLASLLSVSGCTPKVTIRNTSISEVDLSALRDLVETLDMENTENYIM